MKKDSTLNTFQDGLIMDLNPLLTPNSALTNCLNGTIVTFNGNENVLQNDMGNGRVETAYLPQGYVPVGTAELGGIIYIVSYNPLINKCQIGCFPSPERNITSDEIQQGSNCSINNSNFRDKNNDITTTEYKVELLPDNMKLNPGDQYSIYSTNKGISNNFDKLSFIGNINHTMDNYEIENCPYGDNTSQIYKNVEIHVISISDDGKITYLDDSVKWFKNAFVENADYYIREVDDAKDETINTDIDKYRSLVSSAYNIFNSKTSGKLALLFKLNVIDTFSATWEYDKIQDEEQENEDGTKRIDRKVKIKFNINYTSKHSTINPNRIISNITNTDHKIICTYKKDKGDKEIQLSDINWMNINIPEKRKNDGTDSNISVPLEAHKNNGDVISTDLTFVCKDFNKNNNYQLVCELTPSMSFGNLPYLKQELTINLEKINSGEIGVNDWRYYVASNEATINFNLDAYTKKEQKIEEIKLQFLPPQSLDKLTSELGSNYISGPEKLQEDGKKNLPYYEECDKIIQTGKIQSGQYQTKLTLGDIYTKNCLFLVDIVLKIANSDNYEYYHYLKFLYTCDIFNNKYYSGESFDNLCIEECLNPTIEYNISNSKSYPEIKIPDINSVLGSVPESDAYANGTMCAQTTNINDESNIKCNIVDENYSDLFIYKSSNAPTTKVKDIKYINANPISDTTDDEPGREAVKSISDINATQSNEDLDGIIKTSTENDKYKDYFIPKIENNKLNIKGVIYSRINAKVEKKDVKSQNCLRPVLYTIDDLDSLGLARYGNNDINFKYSFVMESGDHGKGGDFSLTMRKYQITSATFPNKFAGDGTTDGSFNQIKDVRTGENDFGGDGHFTKNWNQVDKFKKEVVPWMEETGNLFAFWQFNYRTGKGHIRKWKDKDGCENNFERHPNPTYYANLFMIRGYNNIFYPINYFMANNYCDYDGKGLYFREGSNKLSKVIMALLTQLYYVQKDTETSVTVPRVTNINYVNDYNVELELEFSRETTKISAKIKPYTDPDTEKYVNEYVFDDKHSMYPNIYVEGNKNATGIYTKNYFINIDDMYDKYSSNKSLNCSCIAKTPYGNFPINDASGEKVLYIPKCFGQIEEAITEFTPSFTKNEGKNEGKDTLHLYINTELKIDDKGVIKMSFPSKEKNERITDNLISSLRIDDNKKLYADDSVILRNNSDMQCAEYSANSTYFNITFKGNSSVLVYDNQNNRQL